LLSNVAQQWCRWGASLARSASVNVFPAAYSNAAKNGPKARGAGHGRPLPLTRLGEPPGGPSGVGVWRDPCFTLRAMESIGRIKSQKKIVLSVIGVAIALIVSGMGISLWAGKETRIAVADRFNEEQLVIARSISARIERELRLLKREIGALAQLLGPETPRSEEFPHAIRESFKRVMENGVYKIELLDLQNSRSTIYTPFIRTTMAPIDVREWSENLAVESSAEDEPWVSASIVENSEPILKLAAALTADRSRAIVFHVHIGWFVGGSVKYIRSGRTGYAWIIDQRGTFLYHPYTEYIGKDAFRAREDVFKNLSFVQINQIQRESMLKGKEGIGVYSSAWHRGITGEIQKLIAYTPIKISDRPDRNWSVAVVAPVFEIEEALTKIHRLQTLLQGLVLLVVVVAAGVVLFFQLRWSRRLETLVAARTQALKRSEENYRSLVESAEDFIFTVDGGGRLLSVNSFTATCFGGTPGELVGQGVDRLFTTQIADRQIKIVQTVYETGKSVRDEFELAVGDTPIWISANFMPLKNEAGRMSAVLCIARDITENKRLERFLINTEKLASLGTLAAGVAHEINNPLGVMLGFCDLLVRNKAPDSQEYEDLKIIERQGLQCKQIVENLLSFARVGQETTADTDLNDCLAEIIKVVRHSLEMKTIELCTEFAETLPRVRGDDRQLQQVFLNLINNAAAAMTAGGRLTIRTGPVAGGQRVAAQVQDQGTGIAPEHLDHIFEPFFTTKPEGEGTGLGLFVSYGIISKYGGTITCESQTHDGGEKPQGTTFTVELPAHKGEEKWRAEF
jgi:two-component system, NtrC family, sensor kinase